MEILQLRYFYESAKNENFSQTAEKFGVPTTSVSASVKRLEKELGCRLFHRTANRITLNSNGLLLQQTLCSVFTQLDETVEKLTVHNGGPKEVKLLVRGMRRKIADLITEYSAHRPDVSFKTVFDHGDVDFKEYDIIIDDDKDLYKDYERIELFTMRLRLKCSADDPSCQGKYTLSQLCKCSFIMMDINSNMFEILNKACNRVGFTPKISVFCNDIECYDKFIESGMGIGVGQQKKDNEQRDRIKDLDVTDFNEHYTVYAYYSQKEYRGEIKAFVEFLASKGL